MSEPKEERKKLEPDPLLVALLRELGDRLLALQEHFRESSTLGFTEPLGTIAVTPVIRTVYPPRGPWFTVHIMNDGPANIQAIVISPLAEEQWPRPWAMWHTVLATETYTVTFNKPQITAVQLQGLAGNANVRVVGVR